MARPRGSRFHAYINLCMGLRESSRQPRGSSDSGTTASTRTAAAAASRPSSTLRALRDPRRLIVAAAAVPSGTRCALSVASFATGACVQPALACGRRLHGSVPALRPSHPSLLVALWGCLTSRWLHVQSGILSPRSRLVRRSPVCTLPCHRVPSAPTSSSRPCLLPVIACIHRSGPYCTAAPAGCVCSHTARFSRHHGIAPFTPREKLLSAHTRFLSFDT